MHQSLAFRIEGRGGLVEDEDRRILQDGTGDADTLALTTRESSATIADVRIESVFALRNEVVGVGYLRGLLYLLLSGIVHAKRDVVPERVVEEDGLLIHVAYQLTQVVYAQILHVDAVNQHLALLHIVVAWNEVYHRRLSAAALTYQRNGLSLGNHQVDVLQHPLLSISEAYVLKLYLVLETLDVLGVSNLLNRVLRHQNLVHALHRGQSLGNAVTSLREVLQRIDNRVEHHHVIDEDRS